MTDTANRVAMRLAETVQPIALDPGFSSNMSAPLKEIQLRLIAAALSSHGLREAVEKIEHGINFKHTSSDKIYLIQQATGYKELLQAILADLLGEGETLKAEEQADES